MLTSSFPQVPLATVLIPVYNAEAYLLEALRSISAQTFADFEILVVDDGSTDRSPELLAEYARADPRLRVLRQANGGISAALNRGLEDARGEFIVRMDADDVMLPPRIQTQVAFLQAHPRLGFCASAMEMIDSKGRVFDRYSPRPRTEAELDQMMTDRLPIVYTHPTVTYRTAAVRALGGYDREQEPCEDMDLFGRLILAGHRGVVLPEILMRYRVHGHSISGSKIAQQVAAQEFVRAVFYARRDGRILGRAEYESQARAASWPERLRARARLRCTVMQRTSLYRRAAGQPWKARAWMALAAMYRPWPALRAASRLLLRPDRSSVSARRA
ncbi:MAG: glycosyltransferase family 2 protein [Rhizobacter sp.]